MINRFAFFIIVKKMHHIDLRMFSEKSNVSLYLGNSCILLTPVMLRKVCRKQNNNAKIDKNDELAKL